MKVNARKDMKPLKAGPLYPQAIFVWPGNGPEGNSFQMMADVESALRREGVDPALINDFPNEAMAGDRLHLEKTIRKWVTCVTAHTTYELMEE